MRGRCSPEERAACPLVQCLGSDLHHQAFPAYNFKTKAEKTWRELPFNKHQLARCVHEGIHASGYVPQKPSRELMVQEIWSQEIPQRALDEAEKQLFMAELTLNREPEDVV